MTPQEIFDTVATHLFSQGEQSLFKGSAMLCAYRGDGGRKCAAGVLIPDSYYTKKMELMHFAGVVATYSLPTYLKENGSLVLALQQVHDHPYNWTSEETLKKALIHYTRSFSLEYSILDTLHLPKKP